MLEHAFKLLEVLDGRLHDVIDIDKMQYGFMPGIGAVDIFVPRSLGEKLRAKNKKLFLYLYTWKRLLIRCEGKLFILF